MSDAGDSEPDELHNEEEDALPGLDEFGLPELADACRDWIRAHGWLDEETLQGQCAKIAGKLDASLLEVLKQTNLLNRDQLAELEEVERLTDTIPQFVLEQRLGAGAVGAVYLAHHKETKVRVALKFLHAHIDGLEEHRDRFEREAATLAKLNHPVIPTLIAHSKGREMGDLWAGRIYEQPPYMAMEFVEGMTLRDLIEENGAVPEKYALWAASQVALALHHAYDVAGIIHRDIKPENIIIQKPADVPVSSLLTDKFPLKIIDFGLAKVGTKDETRFTRAHRSRHKNTDPTTSVQRQTEPMQSASYQTMEASDFGGVENDLTMVGAVLGTPRYMAPEQIMGEDLDWRADLYAVAATLFHLLTGKPPYSGNSPAEVMTAHVKSPIPDPRSIVPEITSRAARVVMKALEKKPNRRYASYMDFAEACDRAINAVEGKTQTHLRATGAYPNQETQSYTAEGSDGVATSNYQKTPSTVSFPPSEGAAPVTGALEPHPGITEAAANTEEEDPFAQAESAATTVATQRLTKTIQAKVRGEISELFEVPSLQKQRDEMVASTARILRYKENETRKVGTGPLLVMVTCAVILIGLIVLRALDVF